MRKPAGQVPGSQTVRGRQAGRAVLCRVQTVKYADNGDGVVQEVSYEGTPQYGPDVVKTAVVAHPV